MGQSLCANIIDFSLASSARSFTTSAWYKHTICHWP